MTQPSETERLKQIRERLAKNELAPYAPDEWWADTHFLLSLIDTRAPVDSQGAEGIADDLPYRIVEEMGLGLTFRSCACGQLPCARLRPLRDALEAVRQNAATQMRTACVAEVKALWTTGRGNDYNGALNDVLGRIESLTLDQVKHSVRSSTPE